MRNRLLSAAAIICGLAFAATPLIAHHSVAAQFDRTKQVTLTGPVVKLDWINPHARFLMDVTDADGKITRWEVELSAPAMLMRRGWTRNALPIGGSVTVNGPSAKDGSRMIYATSVTLSDGKRVFSGSPEELGGNPQQ
jgi:hypothetical protein